MLNCQRLLNGLLPGSLATGSIPRRVDVFGSSGTILIRRLSVLCRSLNRHESLSEYGVKGGSKMIERIEAV